MARGGAETVFWSLAVEEQFYLFWPLLLLFVPRHWWLRVAVGMIALAPIAKALSIITGVHLSFYMLPWQFEYLGAGCLLALLCFRDSQPNRFDWISDRDLKRFGIVAILCLCVAAADWLANGPGLTRTLFMNLLCSVFFAWLVLKTAKGWTGPLGRIFNLAFLQYIGVISYGIYLVHNWMPDLVTAVFGPLPKVIAAPIVVAGTFGLCALSWRYFERPLLAVGRRLSKRIQDQRSAPRRASDSAVRFDAS
jgi:peptidoglycan/LPS O-acetylase OafA/YrhL